MNSIEYRIQSGDTLLAIARRHNVTVEALSRLNGLSDANPIWAGQVLRIPRERQATPPDVKQPRTYRVRAGETLFRIAQRHDVTEEALAQANGISKSSQIVIGLMLKIPPVSGSGQTGVSRAMTAVEGVNASASSESGPRNLVEGEPPQEGKKAQDQKEKSKQNGPSESPIPGWEDSRDSVLILIEANSAFVIPGSGLAIVPTKAALENVRQSSAHFSRDLGLLFEVPAVGAGGSRIFRAGPNGALMVDAGSDPRGRVPAAVYLDQLQGVMSNLGVSRLDKLQIIHVHMDHISSIPEVVARYRLTPDKLSIPRQYLQHGPMQMVINELRARPATRELGYTEAWVPGAVLKDRSGGSGDIFRYSYKVGELTIENVGLRSAFRTVRANPDRASYLTRITRPADQARTVIIGDLRGFDLGLIRTAMEAQRPGSWGEFFQGVTTLSGFSHHLGSMSREHIPGMLNLLDATLLRTGKLRIVEQTYSGERGQLGQVRAETMELVSRLGIELVVAEQPTEGAAPSAAGASKNQVSSRGPQARTHSTTSSPLVEGLSRIEQLYEAHKALEILRPIVEEVDPSSKRNFKELLPKIEQSLQQLRTSVRGAIDAALRVRTEGQRVQGGSARDYGANGGEPGAAYVAALGNIPRTTPAETALGPKGFEVLARYRDLDAKEVPLQVALHAALLKGEYSDKAFAHMLSALDPKTRNSLLTGRRGGASPRLKAFERVRVQYSFQTSVLRTNELSIRKDWSLGAQARARGGAGFLALLEVVNSIILPTVEGIQTQKHLFRGRNLLPFVQRLLFWNQMGIVPKLVGVDDGLLSVEEERNQKKVIDGLNAGRWNALYFEQPGISDADVMKLGVWISYHIRNIDEFFLFFMDSFQDAIMWDGNAEDWTKAPWKIKLGRYNLSWENHVEEYWYTHDKLTDFMRVYTARLMANTTELLEEHGKLGSISQATRERIGTLDELNLSLPRFCGHTR